MRHTAVLAGLLLGLIVGVSVRADMALFESFDLRPGPLDGQGETEVDGWAEAWQGEGLTVKDGVVEGRGFASRGMISRVDFELDDEWFLRVKVGREGAGQGSDYCSLTLTNRDRAVDRKPFYMGINSRESFYALAGPGEPKLFDGYKPGQAYVMIARLKTRMHQKDELNIWVFPADKPLPTRPPSRPDMTMFFDYSGWSQTLELRTGNQAGYRASFDDIRLGDNWGQVTQQEPKTFRFKHPYRKLKPVRVADNGTHMLPNGWTSISVLPWDDARPQLIQMSDWPWIPEQNRIYTQVDSDRRAKAEPAPNPDSPLFDAGRPFEGLPVGSYQAVPRQDGAFDLFDSKRSRIIPMVDGRPKLEADYDPLSEPVKGDNRKTHVADVDGDDVPDLLLSRLRESKWNYWPENGSPWKRQKQPLMGPDRDPTVNQSMRGYDVAGNWLGSPITYELVWAKGRRAGTQLRFGAFEPVYYGRDDFPLLWRNYSQRLAVAVIERAGQRHIVMQSASNDVLAVPVVNADASGLHVGKAVKLLAPDEETYSLNMDNVWGVADFDGDGTEEVLVGSGSSGFVTLLKGDAVGSFQAHVVEMLGGSLAVATLGVPTYGDWDGDGVADLIIGDGQGLYNFYPGTDDPRVFAGGHFFTDRSGRVLKVDGIPNIQGPQEFAWGYTQPLIVDWDGDGVQDLIGNDNTATYRLLKQIDQGDPTKVDDTTLFTMNGEKLPVAWRSRPAVIDGKHQVAGDDRKVLLYLDIDQLLALGVPEHDGSVSIDRVIHPSYTDGKPIQLANWGGLSGRVAFSVVDWDEDGTWDVLFSSQSANVTAFYGNKEEVRQNMYIHSHTSFWLRNAGTNSEPVFERARRIRNADGSAIRVETHAGNVVPADLDGDGKALDLIFCDGPGFVYYFMRDELSWDEDPGE